MAPILTIFGPNRSQRRNLFLKKNSNERRRHRGIVVVVIVAVVVAVVAVVRGFGVACIKGTSLPHSIRWPASTSKQATALSSWQPDCLSVTKIWPFLFCFVPKTVYRTKFFELFAKVFSNFLPSRKFFRQPKFFSKFSWQRCDSFGPKIVKIGAILTVFRPFEISRKFVPYKLLQNLNYFLCGYKIEMAKWL